MRNDNRAASSSLTKFMNVTPMKRQLNKESQDLYGTPHRNANNKSAKFAISGEHLMKTMSDRAQSGKLMQRKRQNNSGSKEYYYRNLQKVDSSASTFKTNRAGTATLAITVNKAQRTHSGFQAARQKVFGQLQRPGTSNQKMNMRLT